VPVHLTRDGGEQHTAAFRALNPMRHVPVLEFAEAGGVHHLAESMAIIEYLEERHPRPALLPADPLLRARARQLALLVVSGIQPLQNTKVQRWVTEQLHADGEAWARHWVSRGLEALEELARGTAGTFLIGDQVTVADVCLVPQLHFARRLAVPLDGLPTLCRAEAACVELPAFVGAHAHNQLDAELSDPA
jgi:maleylpyruvate isomerase